MTDTNKTDAQKPTLSRADRESQEYRAGYRAIARDRWWTLPRISLLIFGVLIAGAIVQVAFQPFRIASKTFDANNVITNYEFFRDANQAAQARIAQISSFKKIAAETTAPDERTRLRIDLAAIQQSCRDLVAKYNANASKANRSIFMGQGVPESLDLKNCE
jgi:hypothetical protein